MSAKITFWLRAQTLWGRRFRLPAQAKGLRHMATDALS